METKMIHLRFIHSIARGFFIQFFYYIPKAEYILHHKEKYSTEDCFNLALKIVKLEKKYAKTKTDVYGLKNLPKSGGYIMYSNHQGKYDALGILCSHDFKPISILWKKSSAKNLLASQVSRLLECEVIDLKKSQTFVSSIKKITESVKNGKPYLIFPEGTYKNNKNNLQEFQTGCFMASIQSKTPIIPVLVYDSWKSMDCANLFSTVKTQVHFLEQIPYKKYQTLNRKQLSELVKQKIQQRIDEIKSGKTFLPDKTV